jgi:hypothetical protein
MNLLEIRKKFVEHSGRYDLVVDTIDYVDDGANFFINSGLRFLEDRTNISKNESILEIGLDKGQTLIKVKGLRVVRKVWIMDPNKVDNWDGISLRRMHQADFDEYYGENNDEGLPASYKIHRLRSNGVDEEVATHRSIVIGPKPDTEYTLFIRGLVYGESFTDDGEANFWSIEYPHTLIQAALYSLERFYRNTQGMNDHLQAIEEDLRGIDHEEVAEQASYRSNMADSFNERIDKRRRYYGF